jgi:hypothetical protein
MSSKKQKGLSKDINPKDFNSIVSVAEFFSIDIRKFKNILIEMGFHHPCLREIHRTRNVPPKFLKRIFTAFIGRPKYQDIYLERGFAKFTISMLAKHLTKGNRKILKIEIEHLETELLVMSNNQHLTILLPKQALLIYDELFREDDTDTIPEWFYKS